MVLAIVGGALIVLGAIVELFLGAALATIPGPVESAAFVVSGVVGIAVGILVPVFGVLSFFQPQHHVVYGVLILVFSVASLVSFEGGFFVGFILGIIGGILAIVHRTTPAMVAVPYYPPPVFQRLCPRCGRFIDPTVRFCPHCGNALG
ncbi:MAG: zinc ribbon domain-containing protein [Thermoplasmata archaeon]|nr:zinc ribbon domain-containing protein [Thermoplasmata archaeon]